MSSFFIFSFAFLLCLFLSVPSAYAVSITVTNPPSSIGTDPFAISVAVSGASTGTNYLRIDLYKDGTTNYFGETYNGTDWYSGSVGSSYLPITIGSDGTWSGDMQARIGDTISDDYNGSGSYFLRVRRYTASGSYNNEESKASAIPIVLTFPTLTPMPTNTPTPIPTAKPTKPPTPTATPKPAKSTTSVNTSTNNEAVLADAISESNLQISTLPSEETASDSASPAVVLATQTPVKKKITRSPKKDQMKKSSNSFPQIIALSLGGILFIACGILLYLKRIKK